MRGRGGRGGNEEDRFGRVRIELHIQVERSCGQLDAQGRDWAGDTNSGVISVQVIGERPRRDGEHAESERRQRRGGWRVSPGHADRHWGVRARRQPEEPSKRIP